MTGHIPISDCWCCQTARESERREKDKKIIQSTNKGQSFSKTQIPSTIFRVNEGNEVEEKKEMMTNKQRFFVNPEFEQKKNLILTSPTSKRRESR